MEIRTCCREEGGKKWERISHGHRRMLRSSKVKRERKQKKGKKNAMSTEERKKLKMNVKNPPAQIIIEREKEGQRRTVLGTCCYRMERLNHTKYMV